MQPKLYPCQAEGCTKTTKRRKRGLCPVCARKAGLYPPLPECAQPGCQRKARSTGKGSKCRHHGGAQPRGRKVVMPSNPCGSPHCRNKALDNGLCGLHQLHIGSLRERCLVDGCTNVRQKSAGLCKRCYTHLKPQLVTCAHPSCELLVWNASCCPIHDIGIDFAAGDWMDWVAAERLFQGRLDDRKPTVPELAEVLRMADRRHVPHAEIGRRLGLDDKTWIAWCRQVAV